MTIKVTEVNQMYFKPGPNRERLHNAVPSVADTIFAFAFSSALSAGSTKEAALAEAHRQFAEYMSLDGTPAD